MATSGEASDAFSGRSRFTLRIAVSRDAVSGNSSRYDYSLRVNNLDGSSLTWAADSFPYSITIEGTTYTGSTPAGTFDFRDGAAYHNIRLGTTGYFAHNSDGYLTVNYTGSVTGASIFGSASASGSFASNRIPKVPDAPGTPAVGTRTGSTIALSWSAPADNGGATITNYYLDRATNSSFTTGLTTVTLGNVTSYTASGLAGGTNYWFRVSAKNSVGTSSESGTRATSTLVTLPTPPLNPIIYAATAIDQSLTWDWPTSDATFPTTGFTIQRALDAAFTQDVKTFSGPGDTLDFQSTGLSPSVYYFYRIAAKNSAGTGPYSTTVSGRTLSGCFVSINNNWVPAGFFTPPGGGDYVSGQAFISDGTNWVAAY